MKVYVTFTTSYNPRSGRLTHGGAESESSVVAVSHWRERKVSISVKYLGPNFKNQDYGTIEMTPETAKAVGKALLHVADRRKGTRVRLLVREGPNKTEIKRLRKSRKTAQRSEQQSGAPLT